MENILDISSEKKIVRDVVGTTLNQAQGRPPKMLKIWRLASRWSVIALLGLLPVFFLPVTGSPVAASKEILLFILALAAFFSLLGKILIDGRARYPGHIFAAAVSALVLIWGVSSYFSFNPIASLIGSWSAPDGFFSVLAFVLLMVSAAMTFSRRDVLLSLLVSAGSLSLLGIFEILQVFKVFIIPFDFAKNAGFNPVGSVNDVGILMALGAVISVGLLSSPETGGRMKKFLAAAIVVFILNLLMANFWAIWTGLAAAMIMMITFLSTGIKSGESALSTPAEDLSSEAPAKGDDEDDEDAMPAGEYYHGLQLNYFRKAWLPSLILLLAVLFTVVPSPLANLVQMPAEVSPSFGATLEISTASLKAGNYFLGSGPNTFGYIFNLYKPDGINQTVFWSTVFTSGISAVTSWVGTVGILGILAVLFFFFAFIRMGISSGVFKSRAPAGPAEAPEKNRLPAQTAFSAAAFLMAMWFLHAANFTVMAVTFIMAGISLAALSALAREREGKSPFRELRIFTTPPKTFLFSFLIVILMAASAAGLYFEIDRYIAEIYFSKAVSASAKNDNSAAIDHLTRAVQFWQYDERYFQGLSQAIFVQLNDLLAKKDLPQDQMRTQFQNIVTNSVAAAQSAKNLNSKNPANSALLGNIYENLVPYISDAANFALSSYGAAIAIDPKNPAHRLSLARVQTAQAGQASSNKAGQEEINGFLDKAVSNLEEALKLKNDYSSARYLLVQIYDQLGKMPEAVKSAEELVTMNANDVGSLFQLGFLYYKNSQFAESKQVFEKLISLSPNYSNARYFLGLIYDGSTTLTTSGSTTLTTSGSTTLTTSGSTTLTTGEKKAKALEQFEKIAELNPDNDEIKKIIANLEKGKPALTGITPPAPAPQNRTEAPVPEGNQSKVQPIKK